LDQLRQAVETARAQLDQAQKTAARQRDLWNQQLTTRESLEKAENDVVVATSAIREREKQVTAQSSRINQERASLESARYDLSKVRIESPIDGIVTRRNIQEGETAIIGTMNNPGTVLLTLADMSIIQAEVEVDETNVPHVQIGQIAKITIDAIPDKSFKGHVTEIGNSPIQTTGNVASGTQATNFKVVVVLDEKVADVRPGFTCTADITTAPRIPTPRRNTPRPAEKTSAGARSPRLRCASWCPTPTARSSASRRATSGDGRRAKRPSRPRSSSPARPAGGGR